MRCGRFLDRLLELCLAAAIAMVLTACGGGGGGGEPIRTTSSVTITSPTRSPVEGDTLQLTAVAHDQFGDVIVGKTAIWSSSNTAIATISSAGLVQTVAPGSVVVTATVDGVSGTLSLTISPRATASVTVTSPTATPLVGDALQLVAVARDQSGKSIPGKTATWSSSNPNVATVSTTGLLQTLALGTVVVTATVDGVSGTLSLTVSARTAASVTITSPTLSPQTGESLQLVAVARDQTGNVISGTTATWLSSDQGIATVSSAGLLQALNAGSVVITATINGVSGSLPLAILPRTTASVTISSPTLAPKEGDTLQLAAVAYDRYGNAIPGTTATWSSSNTGIATVSTAGLLQTLTTGTVVVTATINGVSGTQSLIITAIKVSVSVGAKEVVFDYTNDRCYDLDLPDQPARFVRAEDGSLVLIDGNAPRHYVSRGADFSLLKRDCSQPALISADKGTAQSYENWEWLWAVYREGNSWHALIHNEFHDSVATTCRPGDASPGNPCWYNSITYAVSTDGGHSFSKPSPPAHVVAPAPEAWVPPIEQASYYYSEGYFSPSNIVRASDGYYYAMMSATPHPLWSEGAVLCAIRTATLGDPASWRAWDGSGFNLRMTSPYVMGSSSPVCTSVQKSMASGHLVFNTYLNRYMQIAQGVQWIDGRNACGIYYELSADLVHWSEQQLLVEVKTWEGCATDPQGAGVLEPVTVGYSSIVDHTDSTINFEKAGRTPYLYYTRFNDGGLDRDIVRVPLTLTRQD